MCGIAGAIDFKGRVRIEECLSGMLNTLRRRGPDALGIHICGDGILFHSRLAVIDPVNGSQPMKLTRNGEVYTIVYNGELYNARELRQELANDGETFLGHSDTEVLLKAYAHWGSGCLEKLNGIFAFAVLHQNERKLFLARDRMGVKPLFFSQKGSTLVFGSEIKSLLKYPGIEPVIDAGGIGELLLLGPGRTPGFGVFRDIRELRPGEYGFFQENGLEIHRYWQLQDRIHTDSAEKTVETVRYLVTDAIERQLVSDVPLGTFLSGGLDSSLISSVAAAHEKEQGRQLKTFSVTYLDNREYFHSTRFQPTTDDDYIGKMVEYLDSEHHSFVIGNEELAQALYASVEARDLPGMSDVDSSLLLFCQEIRSHVTVALSGECADELFGGYPWYRDPRVLNAPGFPWARSTAMRSGFLSPDLAEKIPEIREHLHSSPGSARRQALQHAQELWAEDFVDRACRRTLSQVDVLECRSPRERRLREMIRLNTDWFMQTLLDRKDRMSMYHGLEVRVPFCDHRLAEYLYSVPWEMKEMGGMEKGLLRQAAEGLLPDEIRLRKKSPYPKTHNPGYGKLLRSMISDLLEDTDAPIFSLISREALEKLRDNEFTEPWYGQLMTGPQTMAYMVQLNHWLKHYRVRISV
ncbi:MAG: asparagine synthase (glutamine-hydrolyzing) [Anaerovoracaceae bacterium]